MLITIDLTAFTLGATLSWRQLSLGGQLLYLNLTPAGLLVIIKVSLDRLAKLVKVVATVVDLLVLFVSLISVLVKYIIIHLHLSRQCIQFILNPHSLFLQPIDFEHFLGLSSFKLAFGRLPR